MNEYFDDQLLDEFAHTFYGYGNYGGRYWFIGMEEGGGSSFAEISKRLTAWTGRGRRELEDVAEYHAAIGITHLFSARPKLQSTWNKLIRILLCSNTYPPTTEQVREYQRDSLGRLDGDTCLLELLPLPSPSTDHWLYGQHSQLLYLANRQAYRQACLALRIAHLRQCITKHQPMAVVFYGLKYQEHWPSIAGVDLRQEPDGVYTGNNRSTLFVMTKHPTATGVTNEYFHQVGRLIHDRVDRQ